MFNRELILTFMESKGWTKYKLAKESGLAHSTLHDIISGKNVSPTAKTLQKIADALEVSIDDFFKEDTDNTKSLEDINRIVKENKIETLAAHFEGEDFTQDDLNDIEEFIKYVVSRKKK